MPIALVPSVLSSLPGRVLVPRLVCTAVLAVLAGCANPVVKLDIAGHSVQHSPPPTGEPASMEQAVAKLNHVRATYYESIRDQRGNTQNSVTGLVWLGAVMLGAASHVHKDVLVTTGIIGATTYGLTAAQLDQRRIDVWQAGIDALDCARDAIVPLEITDGERDRVKEMLATLRRLRDATEKARDTLAADLGTREVTVEDEPAINELLATVQQRLAQVKKTQDAGDFLLRASRGSELSAAVNHISGKVTQVQNTIALPVTAVKEILSGLPAQIDMLVPGALPKPTTSKDATKDIAQSSNVVAKHMETLKQALSDLAAAQKALNDLLANVDASAAIAALKACKVADVIKPFELVPSTETFTQGLATQTKGFEIKGGLSNYRVKALGTLPEGVSMTFEGDTANTVSITVSEKAQPTEARILVSDRSNPPQTQQFVVKVEAPPKPLSQGKTKAETVKTTAIKTTTKPASTSGTAASTAVTPAQAASATVAGPAASSPVTASPPLLPSDPVAVEAAWKELQAALAAPGFTRALNGVTLSVESTQFKDARLYVKLKCSKPDAGLPAISVREDLAAAAPNAKATLLKNNALDSKLKQIDLSRSKPCVKD